MSKALPVFEWEKEPPAEWQPLLDAVCGRSELVSWLVIGWVPGTPDDPIQRWAIYEATPARMVDEIMRDLLDDLLSRTANELSAEQLRIVRYWKEHGALLEPFWIIQGDRGGHKFRFNASEERYLRLAGLPEEPPLPGALPYAPFDELVLASVQQWDALRKGYANLKQLRMDQRREGLQQFRAHIVKWLQAQVVDPGMDAIKGLSWSDIPTLAPGKELPVPEDLAESDERYIKTGQYY